MVRRGNICIYNTNCIKKAGKIIQETHSGVVLWVPQASISSPVNDVLNVKPEVLGTTNLCPVKKARKNLIFLIQNL